MRNGGERREQEGKDRQGGDEGVEKRRVMGKEEGGE